MTVSIREGQFVVKALNSISENAREFGFVAGPSGPHSSRTMTLDEVDRLLDALPADAEFDDYERVVVEDNLLHKATLSNRNGTLRRLRELYTLDKSVPLFRVFRNLWDLDSDSRPLLALLIAYARDPLLRATAAPVLATPVGMELIRQTVTQAINSFTDDRMSASTVDKVARNTSSSWSQAGHLSGRVRKIRQSIFPTPTTIAFAILLAYVNGDRGKGLLSSEFVQLLDADEATARARSVDARRLGLIDLRESDDVFDVSFKPLLTDREWRIASGKN